MKLFSAIFVLILLSSFARGADWPRWRGPNGNGVSTEKIAASWPEGGPKQVWTQPVGIGFSSPIARDGRIYLFSQIKKDEVLTAFDAATGNIVWTQSYTGKGNYEYPAARATPTIDGDVIYTYGVSGELICRKLLDGTQVWKINVLELAATKPMPYGQASSPLIVGDSIYVMCGQRGKSIAAAFNKTTGEMLWSSQANDEGSYAALVMADVQNEKQLIAFGGENIFGIEPATGKTIWTSPWKNATKTNCTTPVYDGTHLFVSCAYNKGSVMLSLGGKTVTTEWEQKDLQCRFQAPVLDGKNLFCCSGDAGLLKCLSWPDGKTLWTAKDPALKLGIGGSIVRVGDKLITMSERGKLSLVQTSADDCKLISQLVLFDYDHVWSTPLVYQGKLYAKGKDQLVCLDVSSEQ